MSNPQHSPRSITFLTLDACQYGLTASIFTTSLANAHRAAARIDAGYVWVNSAGGQALGTPYGGMKQSGYGRDKVLEEMLSHTVLKNIAITLWQAQMQLRCVCRRRARKAKDGSRVAVTVLRRKPVRLSV